MRSMYVVYPTMCSASASAAFARSVIPSGSPGPSPTAVSCPGSASKSSTVEPTFSSVEEDAPQDDEDESELLAPPQFDSLVVSFAPQLLVDASVSVVVSSVLIRSPPRHARRAG